MSNTRISHGETLPIGSEPSPQAGDCAKNEPEAVRELIASRQAWPFRYRFPDTQKVALNRLPEAPTTVASLRSLGQAMCDPNTTTTVANIPTIYTFFGQFVDHDITLEKVSDCIGQGISGSNPTPIPTNEVETEIVNSRSPNLDLDNIYPVAMDPTNKDKVRIDKVVVLPGHPLPQDLPGDLSPEMKQYNDLPRYQKDSDRRKDRMALIGDPRNDDNLITSQLTVAFLHAHNALVDRGHDFYHARKILIQHYQWIVLSDFLCRITDPTILRAVRKEAATRQPGRPGSYIVPLEFSVAAYRFGHSQIRHFYANYNSIPNTKSNAALLQLFAETSFSGCLNDHSNITADWVIDWTSFVNIDPNDQGTRPRPIDTLISSDLLNLPPMAEIGFTCPINLAVRNLLRGYILSLPTGQAFARAVANAMPNLGICPLTPQEIESAARAAVSDQTQSTDGTCPPVTPNQLQVLQNSEFLDRTPLWFYILAEAYVHNRGKHLGPAGSFIVAEVLIGILLNSTYSILAEPGWRPSLRGRVPGEFDLSDLLILAGVL
jgi:hypothetical protein